MCCCRLVVAEGGEDVTIKVSDEGGGIPRSGLARIWTYLYSTAKSRVQVEELQVRLMGCGILPWLWFACGLTMWCSGNGLWLYVYCTA
jgi:hypothetical protein